MSIDQLVAHLQRMQALGLGSHQACLGRWDEALRPIEVIEEVFGEEATGPAVVLRSSEEC